MQQTVYSGEAFKADKFKPHEVMELLFDDDELDPRQRSRFMAARESIKVNKKKKPKKAESNNEKIEDEDDEREDDKGEDIEIEYDASEDKEDDDL